MNDMSKHAAKRSQQRAIAPMVIDLLLQFGSTEKAGDGASRVFFDKAARRRLDAYAGPLAPLLRQHLDLYAVMAANGNVITVAHRLERIHRH